jgi:hypothetical protein
MDLRAATTKQVQQLRFVDFEQWFPPRRDDRASKDFYTPLQKDFYNAYLNSGAVFRPQRVCNIESIVAAVGEHIRPYLIYLSGLIDLIGRTRLYVPSWVRQFYATLWIDPQHRYIHFAFRGRDYRLTSTRVREILRLQEQLVRLHDVCYGQTTPPRRPHGGMVPPTDLVRHCFKEPFGEGSSRTPSDLTPTARVLDAIMRRTLISRMGYHEGLSRLQLWLLNSLMQ